MNCSRTLGERVLVAFGTSKASLVLKHARVVNVLTGTLEEADVAIEGGSIVGVSPRGGTEEVDLGGMIPCPGLVDGYTHLENFMISPGDFCRAVLPHGTTAMITDPYEIAGVAGMTDIRHMVETTENLDLDVSFILPFRVPSTGLNEPGAVLDVAALESSYKSEEVLELAELVNSYGAMKTDAGILEGVGAALTSRELVDRHAPFFSGTGLNAYVAAGVISDHECSDIGEAREKYARGQWVMVREDTAAKNLEALMSLSETPYYQWSMLVTGDRHPGDSIRYGHINYTIRSAVKKGTDPVRAIKMSSFNMTSYFETKNRGAVAPEYLADLVLLKDLESFRVLQVWKAGEAVAENGVCLAEPVEEKSWDDNIKDWVFHFFHMEEVREEHLIIPELANGGVGKTLRVIGLMLNQLITTEMLVPYMPDASRGIQPVEAGRLVPGADIGKDIVKLAVFKRHHYTGHVGLGSLDDYGLKKRAMVPSIIHSSHNLIIAGTNGADMVLAGNCVRKNRGGLTVMVDGRPIGELLLPIGGLMTGAPADEVEKTLEYPKGGLRKLGILETVDPFMTPGFVSSSVIPKLRLSIYGVIDADSQSVVPTVF